MSDQPSGFTVTDRRKFTIEGDLREGAATAEETPATPPTSEPATAGAPKLGPKLVENASPVETEVVNRNLEPLPAEDESVDEEALDEEALPPEPTAAESAAQDADYRASSKKLDDMISQANPSARDSFGRGAEMNFDKLVQSIYMTAALQMGAGTQPGEQPRVDILGARQSIDMLSVLVEKTKGNLTDKEQRLLQNALFELRMMFMEITNAISSSAHNPAAKPPIR
jgi:Domain of unknown function (DUF1844)